MALASVVVLLLILAAIILMPRPARFERWVDLDSSGPQTVGPSPPLRPVLRVAVAPVMSPERAVGAYRALAEHLAGRLGRQAQCIQRPDYGQINELVRQGACDLALVCTYAFVRGEREFGMVPLVVPVVHGRTHYNSLIVTRNDGPVTSLLAMRSRRFAGADLLSNTGWVFPAGWLRQQGEDPETFFGQRLWTGSHDWSVHAVLRGFADGAAVSSLVYDRLLRDDPEVAARTRVVLRSPDFGTPPFVVPAGSDPALRASLLAVLLHLHEDQEGGRILATLDIDRLIVPSPGFFDSVRDAALAWERP